MVNRQPDRLSNNGKVIDGYSLTSSLHKYQPIFVSKHNLITDTQAFLIDYIRKYGRCTIYLKPTLAYIHNVLKPNLYFVPHSNSESQR